METFSDDDESDVLDFSDDSDLADEIESILESRNYFDLLDVSPRLAVRDFSAFERALAQNYLDKCSRIDVTNNLTDSYDSETQQEAYKVNIV